MLVRRMLVQAEIQDDEYFFATIVSESLPGVKNCAVREGMIEDSAVLVILDGTLLDVQEKKKWLKTSLYKRRWIRVTGTLETSSYVEGFFERQKDSVYQPMFQYLIN